MTSHPRLLVALDILVLLVLGGYVFAGLEKVPFHGDEASVISSSEDYYTLFYQHDWQSIRVRGNLWRTREQYLRTMNGAVAAYTIGLAWDLAGYSIDDLNGSWRWSDEIDTPIDQWVYNLAQNNKPTDHLLYLARIPSTAFTVLSIVVLYAIAWTLTGGSRLAAWIACLSYTTTPAILLNGRRAIQEGPLLFSSLLVILVAIRVIRTQTDEAISWRRRAAWYLGLGAASGFAMASKHTSATIIAAAFLTVGGLPHLKGQMDAVFMRRHYYTLVAAALLAWLVMIVLMPVWWSLPILIILAGLSGLALASGFGVRRAVRWALVALIMAALLAQPIAGLDLAAMPIKMVAARAYLMHKQTQSTYSQNTLGERVKMLVDQAYFAGPQYYEDPLWADFEPIKVEIAAYRHAHLDGRRGVIWGVLLIALDGLGAWWLYQHRRQGTTLLIACWLAILVLTLLANPLAWQRYYIVLIAPLSLVAGMGAHKLVSLFPRRAVLAS